MTTTTTEVAALAKTVADVARRPVVRHCGGDTRSCIATTRVVVDALTRLGVAAEPIQVECIVFNRSANRLGNDGMSLDEINEIAHRFTVEEPHGPWTIHLGPPDPPGLTGHVAAWLPDHRLLVDGSIDQASRPQKGIRLAPVVVGPVDEWPAHMMTVEGATVAWFPDRAGRKSWARSRDWNIPTRTAAITDAVVRAVAPVACG